MSIHALSFGAGVQSTAMLVLAARKEINFQAAIFANVGDDSENPLTLTYYQQYAVPYAKAHGIDLVEVSHGESLYASLVRRERSVHIPVRMSEGAPGRRGCTHVWKRIPVAREMKRRGGDEGNTGDAWHRNQP